jgi:signal transduction histidine kinase
VWASVDPLAFWRAIRNVVGNAVEAAGPEGTVAVRVSTIDGHAIVDVDDDGPGFDASQPTVTSLGLGIVDELVASWGGELEIRRGRLGGCRVRLRVPVASDSYSAESRGAQCAS